MNPSTELKEIMLRFYASGSKMDFWTRQEGALLIGSDPEERLADSPKFILPNGRDIPCRVTTLFHKEDGEWRIVQHRVSIAIPNAELLANYGL